MVPFNPTEYNLLSKIDHMTHKSMSNWKERFPNYMQDVIMIQILEAKLINNINDRV